MRIGNSLKYFRKKNGFTQKEISEILNVAQNTYSGYENDLSEPYLDTLVKLADTYEITIDILIGHQTTNKAVS